MNHTELLVEVQDLLDDRGLVWHYCRDSRRCQGTPGLPDLVIVGQYVLFAELKGDGDTMSSGQTSWKWVLLAAGARHVVWTSRDLTSGRIRDQLAAVAGPVRRLSTPS
ncbi:MAG: hypothetical protein JWO67_5381 [Streptosporangiaceae bacterium]|nr:hypothetical protein [Streptosporangiaceae bacterium]